MKIVIFNEKEHLSSLSEQLIQSIFQLMLSLYPDMTFNNQQLLKRLHDKVEKGYHLLAMIVNEKIVGLCGYNIFHSFGWDDYLYIYDLVVDEAHRSQKYGLQILKQLEDIARDNECKTIRLDSRVERTDARRFYLKNDYDIFAFHYIKHIS